MDSQQQHGCKLIAQSGVIPYRVRHGRMEVALVTASGGPHWTVPKGHIEPDMTPEASAAKEAYEESGLIGRVEKRRIGSYVYEKRGRLRHVDLFPMAVSKELKAWPEMLIRERRWMPAEEAAAHVRSAELRCCIQKLGRTMERSFKRARSASAA